MVAMEPVWRFLNSLEGFEFTAFWLGAGTGLFLMGFFLDYIMQRLGFGPLVNALFVIAGVWIGLYVRYNYLQPNQVDLHIHDPLLTIGAILTITVTMLVGTALVRNRFG